MGRHGIKHTIVCVDCGARAELSKTDARRAHWSLWPGGGRCAACERKRDPKPDPFMLPAYREVVIVACLADGCAFVGESSQLYADGSFKPGLHWTKDPELVQRTKDSRARRAVDPKAKIIPLPLCPGWDKAGRVERVERVELIPLPEESP